MLPLSQSFTCLGRQCKHLALKRPFQLMMILRMNQLALSFFVSDWRDNLFTLDKTNPSRNPNIAATKAAQTKRDGGKSASTSSQRLSRETSGKNPTHTWKIQHEGSRAELQLCCCFSTMNPKSLAWETNEVFMDGWMDGWQTSWETGSVPAEHKPIWASYICVCVCASWQSLPSLSLDWRCGRLLDTMRAAIVADVAKNLSTQVWWELFFLFFLKKLVGSGGFTSCNETLTLIVPLVGGREKKRLEVKMARCSQGWKQSWSDQDCQATSAPRLCPQG